MVKNSTEILEEEHRPIQKVAGVMLIWAEHLGQGHELCCPAERGRPTRIVRRVGGLGKQPGRPSPPGQLQQVVGRCPLSSRAVHPSRIASLLVS
jgi:hypothetical protein